MFALVDDDDFDYLSQFKWYFNNGYAIRNSRWKEGKRHAIHMHRVINNTPDGMDTDHISMDRLDNRKSNLRSCSRSQNRMNVNVHTDNISGFKGVGWHKRDRKWQAQIMNNGENYYLGSFDTPEEAAMAYNHKAKELFGEFAG